MTELKSPKPLPPPLAMSNQSTKPVEAEATASPIPKPEDSSKKASRPTSPHREPSLPQPKLRLDIYDLTHAGALRFQEYIQPVKVITDAVTTVLQSLYEPFIGHLPHPPVRSISLILRPMGGVAYTTGTNLDDEHKEIHFSLDYIASISNERIRDEIIGVIIHEMVHVWQWNGLGAAPEGLIEGVADFVRLKAGYSPPHWKRSPGDRWDAGYQHTAFFLEWLEHVYGTGKVMAINERLKGVKYDEDKLWKDLFGHNVSKLWNTYKGEMQNREKIKKSGEGATSANSNDVKKEVDVPDKA